MGLAGLAALAGGCHSSQPPLALLPETMGVWRRTALRQLPASDAPDPVPWSEVARAETAEYSGPGKLVVRLYELGSPEAGASLMQRWRPSADTVFFNRSRYFVVVKWQQAERDALKSFVRDLSARIPEK